MRLSHCVALVTLLTVDASAQIPSTSSVRSALPLARSEEPAARAERAPTTRIALSDARFSRLYFDVDTHGATWVRGRAYKARFDSDGATYYPFLGSDAPQLYPVTTSLASATAGGVPIALEPGSRAVRNGDSVAIDRGPIDEVYELSPDAVEQTFVIESLPASGDVVLHVRVDTQLQHSEQIDEFRFGNERGYVKYSRASVRTTDGTKIDVETSLVEGSVEIRVPADVVACAGLPLVVDPLISVFLVDQYQDQFSPDVAYDATNDLYVIVEQERFASVDDDVYSVRVSSAGAHLGGAYVDFTTADWREPRVANLNAYDKFLVVASIQDPSIAFGQRFIGGRVTLANALAYAPQFAISDTSVLGEMVSPDVGGDPYSLAPAYFCVVWQSNTALVPQTTEVVYRMLDDNGAPLVNFVTSLSTVPNTKDERPSISNGNGASMWTIAWQRKANGSTGPHSIWAARVQWTGALTSPAFLVIDGDSFGYDLTLPSVASPFDTGEVVIALIVQDFTRRILAFTLNGTTLAAPLPAGISNVDGADPNATHSQVSVDSDGRQVTFAYTEYLGATFNLYVSSYHRTSSPLGQLWRTESRVPIEAGADDATNAVVCAAHSTGGSPSNYTHYLVGFDRASPPGSNRSIWAALYDGFLSGAIYSICNGDGTLAACPCGNYGSAGHGCANSINPAGALLASDGLTQLSTDTFRLTASGVPDSSCLFFQGTDAPLSGGGLVFGDGLRCAYGTVVRLGVVTASGGAAAYPTISLGQPPISVQGAIPSAETTRVYQVWYRNSASFCTPAAFNLTNALKATWIP